MTEILERDSSLRGEFGATWYDVPRDLTFEEYERTLVALAETSSSVQWWIGDLLVRAEDEFGEEYAQAIDATGVEPATLANYAWVARAVHPADRREELSWSHHKVVAKLDSDEQAAALERAVSRSWSVRDLWSYLHPDEPEPSSEAHRDRSSPSARPERVERLERVAVAAAALCREASGRRRDRKYVRLNIETVARLEAALGEVPPS